MKILIIEDSVRLADTIAEALQNENYAVDIANDGQIGYEHASTGIYDMVILDLMLPKMNGYEVLSACAGMETMFRYSFSPQKQKLMIRYRDLLPVRTII